MLLHNSHSNKYRTPFGAIAHPGIVELALQTTAEHQGATVQLRIWQNSVGATVLPMQSNESKTWHSIRLDTAVLGFDTIWYYFIIEQNSRLTYYGNNEMHCGGIGQASETEPPGYQITLYQECYPLPTWFTEGSIYQIFPDRFCKALPECEDSGKFVRLHHNSWDHAPLYMLDAVSKAKVDRDYFGGNLRGIIAKLPYLQALGITIIYLNPIFEADSNHRYNTADYLKVDELLGTNEEFSELCAEAAKAGIRIILDGVFSHTGSNSVYFNQDGTYPTVGAAQSPTSPYYSWYKFNDYPEEYECWWGVKTLPNTNETQPDYRNFIIDRDDSVLKHWLAAGAAGWRLDVADELPLNFLGSFYQTLKQTDPEAVLISEVWEDATNKISYGELRNYLNGSLTDSVMNYPLRQLMLDFALNKHNAVHTAAKLMNLYENYPRHSFFAMMNLLGSHDRARLWTVLADETGKNDTELVMSRLRLITLWQFTFPGVPCVYYGDEVGVTGGVDPHNRATYPWGHENTAVLTWYRSLLRLRNNSAALRQGSWQLLYAQDTVLAYLRTHREQSCLIVLNAGTGPVQLNLQLDGHNLTDLLTTGQTIPIVHGCLTLTADAVSGRIFEIK